MAGFEIETAIHGSRRGQGSAVRSVEIDGYAVDGQVVWYFHVHEGPIGRSPRDAIRAFLDSALDYLAIGNFLVKGPVSSAPTRKKWEGKSKWGRARHAATAR